MTTEASLEVSSPIRQAEVKLERQEPEETIEDRLRGGRSKRRRSSSESGANSPGKTPARGSVKEEKDRDEAEKLERAHQNEAMMIESDELDKVRENEEQEEEEEAEAEEEEEKEDSVMNTNEEALNDDEEQQDQHLSQQKVSLFNYTWTVADQLKGLIVEVGASLVAEIRQKHVRE